MYRRLYFIGIIAYIIMLFYSVLFYKERIIFLDTSFSLFHIIKDRFFSIQVYRFGDIFNQLLPVLATRAKLPVNDLMISYSLGYMIYYFLCYFICGSILKRYDFALTILLLNVLFVSGTFYWITSQLPQSMALLMLTLAYACNTQPANAKPARSLVLVTALITLAFFHPLLVFVMLYAVIFFTQESEVFSPPAKILLHVMALIYFATLLLKALIFSTPYERSAMSGMKNFITQFPDYFTLYSNKRFLTNCVTEYYWIPLLFACIVIYYAKAGKWKNLWLFLSFFLGYLLLINVSYPTSVTPPFYIESLYLPLSIFLALPFVFDILPVLEKKKLALPMVSLIVLTGIVRLYSVRTTYSARLDHERKILDKYGAVKVIAKAQKEDKDILQMLWGSPFELLLLSECERNKPASIIIDDDPMLRQSAYLIKNALVVNWDVYAYSTLNPEYFHFTDTTTGYVIER